MSNTTVNGNPSKIKSVKKTTSRLYTDSWDKNGNYY
ncbi:Uncharacterised protein [Enterococcus hirae]|nr:Uncharacterised protein [Enterococcus hirae]